MAYTIAKDKAFPRSKVKDFTPTVNIQGVDQQTNRAVNTVPREILSGIRHALLRQSESLSPYASMQASENSKNAELSAIPNSQPILTTEQSPNTVTRTSSTAIPRRVAPTPNTTSSSADKHGPPRLSLTKSAPAEGLEAMVDETPSQARNKMYNSFNGFEDINGDTQPIESQLFQDYAKSHAELAPFMEPEATYAEDEESDGEPLYNEDEVMSQEADMAPTWDEAHEDTHVSSYELNAGELSPQTESRLQLSLSQVSPPSSSPKFVVPKTPAIVGYKRNSDGDLLLTSATKTTPGSAFGNAFAKSKTGVSLTQMFDATQAETPTTNDLRSDPIFLRPSPSFGGDRSSPTQWPVSSPVKKTRSDPPCAMTEPRNSYITMKESQEMRERRKRREDELERLRSDAGMDSDDMMSREERLAERRRRRAELIKQALQDADLTAPKMQVSSHRKVRSLISSEANYVTLGRSAKRRTVRQVIEISDGEEEEDDDSVSSDELGDDIPVSSIRSRSHEQVERAVQVPMTSSRPKGSSGKQLRSSPPRTPTLKQLEPVVSPTKLSQRASEASQVLGKVLSGSQTVAVADSQPTRSQQASLRRPAELIGESSLDSNSKIGQSQPSLTSSQANRAASLLKVKSSSFPRPPPLDSSQPPAHGNIRVPSSPPMLHGEVSSEDEKGVVQNENMDLDEDTKGDAHNEIEEEPPAGAPTEDTDNADPLANDDEDDAAAKESSPVRPRRRVSQRMKSSTPVHEENEGPDDKEMRIPDAPQSADLATSVPSAEAATDSHNTGQYQTAHSHLTPSPKKKPRNSQRSHPSQQTSELTPLRSMKDIAADQTPHRGDTQDLNFNIMTADDEDWTQLVQVDSPDRPAKRRRVVYGKKANKWGTPSPRKSKAAAKPKTPLQPRKVVDSSPSERNDAEETSHVESPRAAEEHIFSMPALPKSKVSTVSHGPGRLPKLSKPIVTDLSSGGAARRGPKRKLLSIAETPQSKASGLSSDAYDVPQIEGVMEIDETVVGPESVEEPTTHISELVENNESDEPAPAIDIEEVLTPKRVFARFMGGPGGNMSYWPATCIGSKGKCYRVRFDDGTEDLVESMHVRSLDLRADDVVKVDRNKMRQKTYVVLGLKKRLSSAEAADSKTFPFTDRCGYQEVMIEVKAREGTQNNQKKLERYIVPLTSVYLTSTMWPRFKDRYYVDPSLAPPSATASDPRPGTPVSAGIFPISPQSRSRRPARNYQEIATSDPMILPPTPEQAADGIFTNMAFGITLASGPDKERRDADRETLERLVRSQGGHVIDPDLECMFTTTASPSSHTSVFALKPQYASLDFVAVLANTHGNRAKYIQALALGIPCLSSRWAHDCVRLGRPLPFAPYLLPAGHSLYLGALRSRTLPQPLCFDPTSPDARFATVLARRDRLLDNKSVLLILGKASAERLSAYRFLSFALGAVVVSCVTDVGEAKKAVGTTQYDWVFADTDSVDRAIVALLDATDGATVKVSVSKGGGKKRKRGAEGVAVAGGVPELRRGTIGGREVRVASDEFMKQSLILGALLDE